MNLGRTCSNSTIFIILDWCYIHRDLQRIQSFKQNLQKKPTTLRERLCDLWCEGFAPQLETYREKSAMSENIFSGFFRTCSKSLCTKNALKMDGVDFSKEKSVLRSFSFVEPGCLHGSEPLRNRVGARFYKGKRTKAGWTCSVHTISKIGLLLGRKFLLRCSNSNCSLLMNVAPIKNYEDC